MKEKRKKKRLEGREILRLWLNALLKGTLKADT
jgi:hypothetical protein